jgi:hypothetical protein
MASLELYFKRALPGIAREHVVLVESKYGLTYLDTSQIESGRDDLDLPRRGWTALTVVASDYGALSNLTPDEAICAILHELARYVPFDRRDIADIHFQTNIGDELFVNEVGSEQWRPGTRTMVPNMFLAGDYCRTFVDVVSLEAAVVSGLEAARAVQAAALEKYDIQADDELARPIDIVEPEAYSDAEVTALKLALAPYAYAAKYWSTLQEGAASAPAGAPQPGPFGPFPDPFTAPADIMMSGTKLMVAPWVMAADFLTAGASAWVDLFRQMGRLR